VDSEEREIGLSLPDLELRFTTDRGVFSNSRVDAGTRLLLQEAPHPTAAMSNVCDLGCGYGPIAVSLAKRSPTSGVWAVDLNERAVALSLPATASSMTAPTFTQLSLIQMASQLTELQRTWLLFLTSSSMDFGRIHQFALASQQCITC
jgi:16S rRNA G1207 methylase RsmC